MLLAGLAAVAAFFVLWIPWNYQGGGGFVGNRYYVNVYPAFLFLFGALRPRLVVPLTFAVGGVLLGPILATPFGAPVAWSTLQAHVRNWPFPHFPLELSLRNLPGYDVARFGGVKLMGRRDVFLPRGEGVWVGGADRVELWVSSFEPLAEVAFKVRNFASRNQLEIELAGKAEVLTYGEVPAVGEQRDLRFVVDRPTRTTTRRGVTTYYYRLMVESTTGAVRVFSLEAPPPKSDYFAYNRSWNENFYVGAVLTYLGDGRDLDRDVYAVEWGPAAEPAPLVVRAGSTFTLTTTMTNTSAFPWRLAGGAAQIKLAYHWLDGGGQLVVRDGLRTDLPSEVPPGGTVSVNQAVRAPEQAGSYVLERDLLFELVSWFGDRTGGKTLRTAVEVVP